MFVKEVRKSVVFDLKGWRRRICVANPNVLGLKLCFDVVVRRLE